MRSLKGCLEGCLFRQGGLCWSLFWRTSHCYGLPCSYPCWLLVSPAFVSGCSFGSVGIQDSKFPADLLFCSATIVFLAPFLWFPYSKIFRLNLFSLASPPMPPFSVHLAPLAAIFSFNFPCFSVVGSLLSPLDQCNTLKIKFKAVQRICFTGPVSCACCS